MVSAEELLKKEQQYVLHGIGMGPEGVPKIFTEGKGVIIKDIEGNEYIDLIAQTSGVMSLGHSHPKIINAINEQSKKLMHSFTSNINIPRTQFAEKLAKVAPGALKNNCRTIFSSGGSESNEVALKFSMMTKKKNDVISLFLAYHGGTLALMSLIGQSYWRNAPIYPVPGFPGFHQIPNAYCYRCFFGKSYPDCDFECARFLEHQIKYGTTNVAAFILEPIQGNGGTITPPSNDYFKIIREICDKYNVMLILDEVQTGTGRTGKYWACDTYQIEPDIITTAKGMGSGFPISATMIRSDLVPDALPPDHWHVFTYGGSPLACAVANAVIDVVLEEDLPTRAKKLGNRMMKRLEEMAKEHPIIGEVRGRGVYIGIELVKDRKTKKPAIKEAEEIVGKSRDNGLLLGISGKPGYGNSICIRAPLITTDEQADKALDILENVLTKVE